MTFSNAVSTCFQKYADFSGRARPAEFWWFFLFGVLVGVGAAVVDAILGFGAGGWGPASIITGLGLVVPNLAVGARRLHDTGRSGWWQLISVIPCLGFIWLIVLWCLSGSAYENKYGAPVR